jgi:hypothetical protein
LGEKNAPPISKRSLTVYEVVPELKADAQMWWYPAPWLQIRAGYNFMVFMNTKASRTPVDFNWGAVAPPWEHVPFRLFDGFNAGVGLIF